MRNAFVVLVAGAGLWMAPAWANPGGETAAEILAREKGGLDGWLKGDPGLYERFRGAPLFDSYGSRVIHTHWSKGNGPRP